MAGATGDGSALDRDPHPMRLKFQPTDKVAEKREPNSYPMIVIGVRGSWDGKAFDIECRTRFQGGSMKDTWYTADDLVLVQRDGEEVKRE